MGFSPTVTAIIANLSVFAVLAILFFSYWLYRRSDKVVLLAAFVMLVNLAQRTQRLIGFYPELMYNPNTYVVWRTFLQLLVLPLMGAFVNLYSEHKTAKSEKVFLSLLLFVPTISVIVQKPQLSTFYTAFGEPYQAIVSSILPAPTYVAVFLYMAILSMRLLQNWSLGFEQKLIAICFLAGPIALFQDAILTSLHIPWIRLYDFGAGLPLGIGMAVALVCRHGRQFHAVEAEIQNRTFALERKNQELWQFNYSVSHDLRAPLVNIQGYLQELRHDIDCEDTEAVKQDIEMMERSTLRLQTLFSDLLELSRAGCVIHPKRIVESSQVITDTLSILSPMLQENAAEVALPDALPPIHADAMRISQIFQNLIENAVKYRSHERPLHIEIGCEPRANHTVFWVQDNGMGISAQNQDKIWELFEKCDSNSHGSGVGLALVKTITEAHGGEVWMHSDGVNQGSRFYFSVPHH